MSVVNIRAFRAGDESGVASVLDRAFGPMEKWDPDRIAELVPASRSASGGLWVADDGQVAVGCVRAVASPVAGAFVVRELAVDTEAPDAALDLLLDRVMSHLAEHGATRVRASTPTVGPYPEAYRRRGFVPVRRALTLAWNLATVAPSASPPDRVVIGDGLQQPSEVVADLHIEGMRPYWDWYIEERGGAVDYRKRIATHVDALPPDGGDQLFRTAVLDGVCVGLAYATDLDAEEADFGGVYVLPAHRGRGIGSALLQATLEDVRRRTTRLVVPETMTGLEDDIPSIRLYKRLGARVRAEYLHLEADGASKVAEAGPARSK